MTKRFLAMAAAAAAMLGACASDYDNNPPGYRGGSGTNWENPPGPAGGPGASPDYKVHAGWKRAHVNGVVWAFHPHKACWVRDPDQNPPGRRGGRGTNWENAPGPSGGPGASPDRNACR